MSITEFIGRVGVQTVVYWGSPTNDGYGGFTFADPVEITGRWEQTNELVLNEKGQEQMTKARVWVTQDVDEGGYMFLGTLDDLDSSQDPITQDGAWRIIAFSKKPRLGSSTDFARKASLSVGISTTV